MDVRTRDELRPYVDYDDDEGYGSVHLYTDYTKDVDVDSAAWLAEDALSTLGLAAVYRPEEDLSSVDIDCGTVYVFEEPPQNALPMAEVLRRRRTCVSVPIEKIA